MLEQALQKAFGADRIRALLAAFVRRSLAVMFKRQLLRYLAAVRQQGVSAVVQVIKASGEMLVEALYIDHHRARETCSLRRKLT